MFNIFNIISNIQPNVIIPSEFKEYLSKLNIHRELQYILKSNPLETIVPFNFWFLETGDVVISTNILVSNNQKLRVRYVKIPQLDSMLMLTPLRSSKDSLKHLEKIIHQMPLYQPFYPENYFHFREVYLKFLSKIPIDNCLFICHPLKEGMIEAFKLISNDSDIGSTPCREDMQSTKLATGSSLREDVFFVHQSEKILEQMHQINSLKTIQNDYEIIITDITTKNQKIIDLDYNFSYIKKMIQTLILVLKHIKENGQIIIHMNLIKYQIEFDLISILDIFGDVEFYRPIISNECCLDIMVIVKNIKIPQDNEYILSMLRSITDVNKFYLSRLNIKNSNKKSLIDSYFSFLLSDRFKHYDIISVDQYFKMFKIWKIGDTLKYNATYSSIKTIIRTSSSNIGSLDEQINELNTIKRVMDTLPNCLFNDGIYDKSERSGILTWEQSNDDINISRIIKGQLNQLNKIDKSKNNLKVSNAWLKICEIFGEFPILSKCKTSFHLCESPGSFVMCLLHFNPNVKWFAQSLSPDDNNKALDDFYKMIEKHPKNWHFGNIMENIDYYSNKIKVDFITADGATFIDPLKINSQEDVCQDIIVAEMKIILKCLNIGGNAILKVFLPFQNIKINKYFKILTRSFREVYFFKPITSNGTNSEFYIILLDFVGKNSLNGNNFDINTTLSTLIYRQIDYLMVSYKNYHNIGPNMGFDTGFNVQLNDLASKWIEKYL